MTGKLISTGRGGAGNVRSTQKDDTPQRDSKMPKIIGKRFTTGRGGKGNMIPNIDPDSTRAAQDETIDDAEQFDVPQLVPVQSTTVGRGGYGNNIKTVQSNGQYSQHSKAHEPITCGGCAIS